MSKTKMHLSYSSTLVSSLPQLSHGLIGHPRLLSISSREPDYDYSRTEVASAFTPPLVDEALLERLLTYIRSKEQGLIQVVIPVFAH
jgi:hypothetical protein